MIIVVMIMRMIRNTDYTVTVYSYSIPLFGGWPPRWRKGNSPGPCDLVRQTIHQAGEGTMGDDCKASFRKDLPHVTEGARDSHPGHPLQKQENGEGPLGVRINTGTGDSDGFT